MWNNIKDVVLKGNRYVIKTLIFNNVEYKRNVEIANNFNKYFVNSIREIRNKIEYVRYINQQDVRNSKFKFRAISNYELRTICKDIVHTSEKIHTFPTLTSSLITLKSSTHNDNDISNTYPHS